MIIGVPKEIKTAEKRVAITPAGVTALVAHGHKIIVEKGAGLGSQITDAEYKTAGAMILPKAADVWKKSDMIMKVKEPLSPEYKYMKGKLIFTYLHLAAVKELTLAMLKSNCTGIAYETIEMDDGSLPLLNPMSEVAGKLAPQVGAWCLETNNGGSGVLLAGVSGVAPAKVAIIGAGTSGMAACEIALGMGAQVTILDINSDRLRYVHDVFHGNLVTLMSNRGNIEDAVRQADLVIGAVLVTGAKAPKLVTSEMIRGMKPGSVIVDISVDQGGCVATTKATTHDKPTFMKHGVVHYCVANMPGIVPRTSTYALTNATLNYALELADKGFERAVAENDSLRKGINIHQGKVTCKPVADAFKMKYEPYTA
ncbi:MAG: alanine dehydrogenase [Candidatus Lernaella stagnicola]|nr:alanine dehydrogenase [Candidatus Lernaella stagnicola]